MSMRHLAQLVNPSKVIGNLLVVAVVLAACAPTATPPPTNTPAPTPTLPPPTATSVSTPTAVPTPTPAPPAREAAVWATFAGFLEQKTLVDSADLIGEVNFVFYFLSPEGVLQGAVQNPQAVEAARAAGIRIVPSLQNGGFDRGRVAAILHDPERRRQHVAEIVKLVKDNNFDGIDVDYESLFAEDREVFSLFIEELSAALHAEGKLLSIAVHAKTDDQGSWSGPQAQDWARLGKAVDEFKIMTYDYHSGIDSAGPIAPLDWIDQVLTYAATVVPPEKTWLGVHFYGRNWVGKSGEAITWQQAMKLLKNNEAKVQRDESGEAWFQFGPEGRNTVYYADAAGIKQRLAAIFERHPRLAGVAIWQLGGEDPANWQAIREAWGGN